MLKQVINLLKLRIGVIMMFTALAAMVATPGQALTGMQILVLAFAVLTAAGSAGAFNQYYEDDIDGLMKRTRNRPFVTGQFQKSPQWLAFILLLLIAGVASSALVLNGITSLYIFLGAFFYAIVYTVWLKRRTWMNIVIGGAAGSFAVLAGGAAVDPSLSPIPILLALVLFFWTPSHFWSLAIAKHDDYAKAGIPMLPVIYGDKHTAVAVLINTLTLVAISIAPIFYGMGWLYLAGAVSGGGYFIYRNYLMLLNPTPKTAMQSFFASLLQLTLLLLGAVLDVYLRAQ